MNPQEFEQVADTIIDFIDRVSGKESNKCTAQKPVACCNAAQKKDEDKIIPPFKVVKSASADTVYVAVLDTPANKIKVKAKDNNLLIIKEQTCPVATDGSSLYAKAFDIMRNAGWTISFPFSDYDDQRSVTAKLDNGILAVSVPRNKDFEKSFEVQD
jgi:HSP20 family molecular chaperone IbpA